MTKPLDQVKSELAKEYSNPNNLRNCAVTTPEEDEFTAFSSGFDACLNHLASVGVRGAWKLSVIFHNGQPVELSSYGEPNSVETIELLPVAAQLAKQAERIAELEKQLETINKASMIMRDEAARAATLEEELLNSMAPHHTERRYYGRHLGHLKTFRETFRAIAQLSENHTASEARQYFKDKGE